MFSDTFYNMNLGNSLCYLCCAERIMVKVKESFSIHLVNLELFFLAALTSHVKSIGRNLKF